MRMMARFSAGKTEPVLKQGLEGGSWSRIPAPFWGESRIPPFFHRYPEYRFFFPKNTLKKANFCKS